MIEPIIKLAVWSIGEHARRNMLPAINKCPSVKLAGVFTRNIETRRLVASEYNCTAYQSAQDLLDDTAVKAVYLSGPNGIHCEQIERCLLANKSVLVEKTALTNLDDANKIVALSKSKKLLVMEAFMYRFHTQFKTLRCLLTSNKYGDMLRVVCEFGFPHLDSKNIRYSPDLSGGALYDAGAYVLSAARQLLGNGVVVKGAVLSTDSGYEVDTKGFALLKGKGGSIAQCGWMFGGSYVNRISIWCSDAHILVDRAFSKQSNLNSSIQVWSNGQLVEQIDTGADNHFIKMLDYFSECVRSEKNLDELDEMLIQAELLDAVKRASLN